MDKINIEEAIEAMNKGRFVDEETAWLRLAHKINEIIGEMDKEVYCDCDICR